MVVEHYREPAASPLVVAGSCPGFTARAFGIEATALNIRTVGTRRMYTWTVRASVPNKRRFLAIRMFA